jgi:hypothetical protein
MLTADYINKLNKEHPGYLQYRSPFLSDVYYIGHPLKMAICQGIKESDHHICA